MISFEVTEDDIDEGAPANCRHCPIALAAKRTFRTRVSAGYDCLMVYPLYGAPKRYLYSPPTLAWMLAFDQGVAVKPFTVELEEST